MTDSEYPNLNEKPSLGVSPANKRYTAFMIDDSGTVRMMLKQILLSENFNVIGEATDGLAGLTQLKEMKEKPDYIFCDIDMPNLNGIETVKQMRPIMNFSDVIMCTSHGEKEIVLELVKMGVKGYIQKPFDRRKVVDRLEEIMKRNPRK